MAKKVTTEKSIDTPATELATRIQAIIAADVEKNTTAKQSGLEVATTFDDVFAFNWAAFKGNQGAEKCGLTGAEYKMVKLTRDQYKTAWNDADLPNFDQRWKYVVEHSKHYKAPLGDESRGKSTEAKLEEAVRAVLRHATTLEDSTMIDFGNQMCDYLGLEVKEAE
jgi:hypothetical protein